MRNTMEEQGQACGRTSARLHFPAAASAEGPFWCEAIGSGSDAALALALHLDVLARALAVLPPAPQPCRPAVAAYLATLRQLARDWDDCCAALADALGQLGQAGASLRRAKPARVAATLLQRLPAPSAALASLAAQLDAMLSGMAEATRSLLADNGQLCARLQAGHVHAFLLSQQASTLQSKLDDAILRQDAYWLQGPHAEQIRQEIALHKSALEGVRRQLEHLQAEQAATRAEAHYLRLLMPAQAAKLGGMERLAAALRTIEGGSALLLAQLRQRTPPAAEEHQGEGQLRAALPQWRALAASTARLRPRTPAGCRT